MARCAYCDKRLWTRDPLHNLCLKCTDESYRRTTDALVDACRSLLASER
jgi:hypothetical protein